MYIAIAMYQYTEYKHLAMPKIESDITYTIYTTVCAINKSNKLIY